MNRTRRATLAGLLVALTVAAGYSLAGLPNVELVTLLIFVSGFLLGPAAGPVVGAVSWGLFSVLNPMGTAVPTIVAAQVASGVVVGLAGALLGPAILGMRRHWIGMLLSGLTGLALTLLFQFAVNAAAFVTFADNQALRAFWAFVAAGIAFTLTHLVWNTAVFMLTLRPLMSVLNKYRLELRW
jgi:energy-coupling factor transport system substrate-specific component